MFVDKAWTYINRYTQKRVRVVFACFTKKHFKAWTCQMTKNLTLV